MQEGQDEPPELRGIVPNTFDHVFEKIESATQNEEFLVRASFLEIYNEDIRDLLSKKPDTKLELKEKKIPFIIRRPIPGWACEYWSLKDLEVIAY